MSEFREYHPIKEDERFRFEDKVQLKRLLKTKKLTERQREALRRLLFEYDYACD